MAQICVVPPHSAQWIKQHINTHWTWWYCFCWILYCNNYCYCFIAQAQTSPCFNNSTSSTCDPSVTLWRWHQDSVEDRASLAGVLVPLVSGVSMTLAVCLNQTAPLLYGVIENINKILYVPPISILFTFHLYSQYTLSGNACTGAYQVTSCLSLKKNIVPVLRPWG